MIEAVLTLLALIFYPFAPIALPVTVAVILGWVSSYRRVFPCVFIMGLMADMAGGRWLGGASAVLLALTVAVALIREQLDIKQVMVVGISGGVGELAWRWLTQDRISGWGLLGQMVVCGVGWWLLRQWQTRQGVYLKN